MLDDGMIAYALQPGKGSIHWDVERDTSNLFVCAKPQPETWKGILSSFAAIL